jgi:hypothetical protein
MVYALQIFHHYLLGSIFKFFTNHSTIKYLVNKLVLGGCIYRWFLLFQEFDFEVVVKPRKHNVGTYYISHIEMGEVANNLDDEILDAQLFHVKFVPYQLVEIAEFLISRQAPREYTSAQHHQLVTHIYDY